MTMNAFDRFAERIDTFRQRGFRIDRLNITREEAESMHADAQAMLGRPITMEAWLNAIVGRDVRVHGVVLDAGWTAAAGVKVSVVEADGSAHELGVGKMSFTL